MVVSSIAHAPVDDRARVRDRALEAHHHPLAWGARPACVRAVGQARSRSHVHLLKQKQNINTF